MKNLFSESFNRQKVAAGIASFIVFTAALWFSIDESTKSTVHVNLDGKEEIVRTHAATVGDLLKELNVSLHSEDFVFPSTNMKIKNNLHVVWKPAKQVEIIVGQEKKSVWTTAGTVREFLEEQKISLGEHDQVKPGLNTSIEKDMNVHVERAFPLVLNDGGVEKTAWTTSTTVDDFLSQQGIVLGELDRVEPDLNSLITKNTTVNVIRVEKVIDVVEEPIEFGVVTKKDESLPKGEEKVIVAGENGLVKKEYEVFLENGKEVSRKLLKENKIKDKKDKVVAVGAKKIDRIASRGQENVKKELTVTATAYTAYCNGCSGVTATGLDLRANPNAKVIAVDPRVIPLGSKVYVDGYGYAVAADTGGAIKGHKIDVFFASKSDAYRWGRKKVKIKILN